MAVPRVLLLDDGELGRIREILAGMAVELEYLRGRIVSDDLSGPYDVVFATVKRTLAFEDKLDITAIPGKPVWIAAHSQDFLPLRVRLRKMGVSFLIQTSVGSDALQLLLLHTLYRGAERRDGPRLPVGAEVRFRQGVGEFFTVHLVDLTHGGTRVLTDRDIEPGSDVAVELPSGLAGGQALLLPARVDRSEPHGKAGRYLLTLLFSELPPASLALLDAILAGKVIGTIVTRLGEELTEETAPLTVIRAAAPVIAPPPAETAAPESWPNRRRHRRVEYAREVTALVGPGDHVILARDLSIEGMRAEPLPELAIGTRMELALYGASGAEPALVEAEVFRDDGPGGTVFRFTRMSAGDRKVLETLIAAGAEIQALDGAESEDSVIVSTGREMDESPTR